MSEPKGEIYSPGDGNHTAVTFEEWLNDIEGHPHSTSSNIEAHLRDAWDAGQQAAAQEIERLKLYVNSRYERAELSAVVEKQRSALQEISRLFPGGAAAGMIARSALEEKPAE